MLSVQFDKVGNWSCPFTDGKFVMFIIGCSVMTNPVIHSTGLDSWHSPHVSRSLRRRAMVIPVALALVPGMTASVLILPCRDHAIGIMMLFGC